MAIKYVCLVFITVENNIFALLAKGHENRALLSSVAIFLLCHSCKIYLCQTYIHTWLPLSSASFCASNMKKYSIVHKKGEKMHAEKVEIIGAKKKKRKRYPDLNQQTMYSNLC